MGESYDREGPLGLDHKWPIRASRVRSKLLNDFPWNATIKEPRYWEAYKMLLSTEKNAPAFCATHQRSTIPLLPAALAFVSLGVVLVRVRFQ